MAETDQGPEPAALFARRPRLTFGLALFAGLAVAIVLQRLPPPAQVLTRTPVVEAVLTDPGSPHIGARTPDVTIVIFTDYRCGICQATDPALEALLAKDPGVQVIFKDWPIFGATSRAAARVALAADRQGEYLAVHQALMASRGPLDAAQLQGIGLATGADARQPSKDEERQIDAQLARHAAQAWSLGLEGTPAYLVGPYLVQGGLGDGRLAALVRRARRAGPPRP